MKKVIMGSALIIGLTAGLAFAHGKGNMFRGHGYNMGDGGYQMGGGGGYNMMDNGMYGQGGKGVNRGGGGWGNQDCPCAAGKGPGRWSPEERQEFLEATVELRKEMHNKKFELREAKRTGTIDHEKVGQLQKDMIDIRMQLQKIAQELSTPPAQ